MAIRKMKDLHFPEHYRLMLDNGKWYLYDNEMSCPVDTVDRRFAFKLIDTGFVDNKRVDFLGRLIYSRRTMLAPDKGQAAVVKDNQAIAPCG
jgi:hypothetical protein